MSKIDARTKFRGTLAVAVLFTGLAAAKGVAYAAPTAPQPVASSGSSDQATGSAQYGLAGLIGLIESFFSPAPGHGSGVS
ncbi:hypothetical protein [Nocardia sp. NPDC004722]